MSRIAIELADLNATQSLGQALADLLPVGCLVLLQGNLGAGKTQLVRAICEHWKVPPEDIASPTFVIARSYRGTRRVYHVDAYRLRDEDELDQIGVEEHFGGEECVFIEWPEKIAAALPPQALTVRLICTGESSRRAELDDPSGLYGRLLEELSARFKI